MRNAVRFLAPVLLAAQMVEREIARGLREPRGGIVRHATIRPRLQRPHERLLHHVLGELQPVRAELPGKHRHEPRALAAE